MIGKRIKGPIYDHVYAHNDHEVGGVLVGRPGPEGVPTVTGSIAALEARGERASVTFTHEAWASVHEALDRDFPGEQIVGWYHSHPGFGIFLSGHDLFIHENFFSGPSQIAYVIDPHAGTEGVFGWRDGKIVVLEEGKTRRTSGGGMTGRLVALGAALVLLGGAGAAVMLRDDPPPSKPRSAPSVTPSPRGA